MDDGQVACFTGSHGLGVRRAAMWDTLSNVGRMIFKSNVNAGSALEARAVVIVRLPYEPLHIAHIIVSYNIVIVS